MDSLISGGGGGGLDEKKTFFNHMFSTSEESKAEFLNVMQYSLFAFIPVIILNKSVQFLFPDVDFDKSSFFILAEIFLQIFFIFFSIIFIHRFISFFNTFSGFKFEPLSNFILPFFIIIFSIQSKLANKINLLFFRASALWNGNDSNESSSKAKVRSYKNAGSSGGSSGNHMSSQADYLDSSTMQTNIFPPAPVASKSNEPVQSMQSMDGFGGPMAANSVLGGSFGSAF